MWGLNGFKVLMVWQQGSKVARQQGSKVGNQGNKVEAMWGPNGFKVLIVWQQGGKVARQQGGMVATTMVDHHTLDAESVGGYVCHFFGQ